MSDEPLGAADCELVRDTFLAQPVAAGTSLAFVAGSLVVLARGDDSAGSRVYAATMAAVGLGSWWYHGPQGGLAEFAHDATIVVLIGQAVATPLVRRLRGRPPLAPAARPRIAWAGVALLTVAGAAWLLGRSTSPWCDPESPLQAHGLWHLLAAAAFTVWGDALWRRGAGR